MINYKLDIAYNGLNYYGWQKQKNKITIQETIENVLKKIFNLNDIKLIGASRTDAKASAFHQIANFKVPEKFKIKTDLLIKLLNHHLPYDISINNVEIVDNKFHSQYNAKKREYIYLVYNGKIKSPVLKNFAFFYPYKINFKLLKKAIKYFRGRHNFISFVNFSKSKFKNPVRTIYKFDFKYIKELNLIIFRITADGFLKGMIRNIIGSILHLNKISQNPKIFKIILNSEKRIEVGPTLPAFPLFLYKVYY